MSTDDSLWELNHQCSRWLSCLLIKELVCFSVIHLNKHLPLVARTLQLPSSPAPFIAKPLTLLSLLTVFSSHSLLHFPFLGHHLATPVKHLSLGQQCCPHCQVPGSTWLATAAAPAITLCSLENLHNEIMMELIFLHLCKMPVDTSYSLFCSNN